MYLTSGLSEGFEMSLIVDIWAGGQQRSLSCVSVGESLVAALSFNMLLAASGISPADVRLLRHQGSGPKRQTPYTLWRDGRERFEVYQALQRQDRQSFFRARYWASFVVPADGSTLFVGLYNVDGSSPARATTVDPLTGQPIGSPCDRYELQRVDALEEFVGRLKIDWGEGTRSWVQKADGAAGDKPIVELARVFREPDFPGYAKFLSDLSALPALPADWITALRASRGVYLLTCPKTKEQYVGSATGSDGFWGRWQEYLATGHGGNVGLKSRDPSDYQISVLEVAGSTASSNDILAMEQLWMKKLQSRDMGLNR